MAIFVFEPCGIVKLLPFLNDDTALQALPLKHHHVGFIHMLRTCYLVHVERARLQGAVVLVLNNVLVAVLEVPLRSWEGLEHHYPQDEDIFLGNELDRIDFGTANVPAYIVFDASEPLVAPQIRLG